jgi:hypothetical protein
MRVVGEFHLSLGFAWPCPISEYDERVARFLESQVAQGVAAAGTVKCFWGKTEKLIRGQGGRIVQVIRNPMEVMGFRMHGKVYHKAGIAKRFLGREAKNRDELFRAHAMYYKTSYETILKKWRQEPVIRLEDLNRSCGSDGLAFKSVMEFMAQTAFPIEYVRHIQEHYLPGYHYSHRLIQQDGAVVAIEPVVYAYQPWRMSWADDAQPGHYWETWSPTERKIYAEVLGPVCDGLGYNYRDRPGFTDIQWPLSHRYPWSKIKLEPIPSVSPGLSVRRGVPQEVNLPIFKGVGKCSGSNITT